MRVKCVICDVVESINNDSPQAKKLLNRPIHTYMCQTCYSRIENRTIDRKKTGNFKEHTPQEEKDEYI